MNYRNSIFARLKKSANYFTAVAATTLTLGIAAPAVVAAAPPSAAPGQNKFTCFQSGDATCTTNTKGSKGSATLTVTGAGAAAVYYTGYNDSIYGVQLSQVTQLSFNYTGTPTAGSPRFSVPIDENNDGYTEAFAFVGARDCNNGAGFVDVIKDPTCNVNYLGVDYANWAAFAAAYPVAEVALTDNYVFVVADDIGTWTVNNVIIGKPGK